MTTTATPSTTTNPASVQLDMTANAARAVLLPCPKCGATEASVNLYLHESNLFECNECEDEFSSEEVIEAVEAFRKWERLFAWLEEMPGEKV